MKSGKSMKILRNLPKAPAPTLPVRVETESESSCRMSLEYITDEQRARAVKSRNENLENAWTYEEIKKLKQLHRSGISRREIAEYFPNRSIDAVGCKLRNLIKKGEL